MWERRLETSASNPFAAEVLNILVEPDVILHRTPGLKLAAMNRACVRKHFYDLSLSW